MNNNYIQDKQRIIALIQEHYVSLEDFFTNHSIDRQGLLMISVFADFVGDIKLTSVLAEKQLQQIEEYVTGNDAHLERMDTFKRVIAELRHEFIQSYPHVATHHITRNEITDFVKSTFEINNPEILFYNSEKNMMQINHIMKTFSGHYFDMESKTLRTHLSGHPDIEVGYPTIFIGNIESVESFMEIMRQAITETDINLTQKRDRVIEMMELYKKNAEIDQER